MCIRDSNNRSALVRVPMYKPHKGNATRVEFRSVDSACNPYLAFALILAAGLKGIEADYEPVSYTHLGAAAGGHAAHCPGVRLALRTPLSPPR